MANRKANEAEPAVYRARHRMARISARKARLVMDLIRNESVERALIKLRFCERRAAPMIRKVLESAVANATQKDGLEPDELAVYRAYVDEGPTIKRWRPRSMGRAFPRLKRTSHLSVELCRSSDASGRRRTRAPVPEAEAAEGEQ